MKDSVDDWWLHLAVIGLWCADRLDRLFGWDENSPDPSWEREKNWYPVFHNSSDLRPSKVVVIRQGKL